MRERDDQPGGAVRLNAIGRSWRDDSSGSPTIRGILPQDQRDPCTLKASREHSVTRWMSARRESKGSTLVPSQRVARFGVIDRSVGRIDLRASVGSTELPGNPLHHSVPF
jgi:hypothetical protein